MIDQEAALIEEKPQKLQFKWFFPLFFRPRRTLAEIAEKNYAVWLVPLLLLMVSALILVLVSAPIIRNATQPIAPPSELEYYPPEQQQRFQEAANMGTSSTVTIVFPLIGKWVGIWVSWFLLGSILHLALTMNGSRSSNRSALNIVAWASLPFFVRDVVQIIAMLVTGNLIKGAGISGFLQSGMTGFGAYQFSLASFIDIYLIWQIILIGIGARQVSGLKAGKAWLATLIAVVIFLALRAVPGLIAAQLGTLSTGGMFFF